MVQTLVLMKSPGSADLLHRLQRDGLLRASAGTMAGCYSAFGLAEGPVTTAMSGTLASEGCNPPSNMNCTLAEILEWLNKVSGGAVLANVAFALLQVEYSRLADYERNLQELVPTELPDAYVAAARISGCGPYNALVEVMADTYDRMQELLRTFTDAPGVQGVSVLRVDPTQTQGFGSKPRGETSS